MRISFKQMPLLILVSLCACKAAMFHQPKLESQPLDQMKFEEDLDECRDSAGMSGSTTGKIALGGQLLAPVMMNDAEYERATTPTSELVDICLKEKGYPVIIEK